METDASGNYPLVWTDERLSSLRLIQAGAPISAHFAEIDSRLLIGEKNGEQIKEFLGDNDGEVWMAKSGAHRDAQAHHGEREDSERRIAFPFHELLVSMLMRKVGVPSNCFSVGTWTMSVPTGSAPATLLVSFHKMVHDVERADHREAPSNRDFLESFSVMRAVDTIVGQCDRLKHNYLISSTGQLLAIDNGLCMKKEWLKADCSLEYVKNGVVEAFGEDAWTPALLATIETRLTALTPAEIDKVFHALPSSLTDLYDQGESSRDILCASLAEKSERVKEQAIIFRDQLEITLSRT